MLSSHWRQEAWNRFDCLTDAVIQVGQPKSRDERSRYARIVVWGVVDLRDCIWQVDEQEEDPSTQAPLVLEVVRVPARSASHCVELWTRIMSLKAGKKAGLAQVRFRASSQPRASIFLIVLEALDRGVMNIFATFQDALSRPIDVAPLTSEDSSIVGLEIHLDLSWIDPLVTLPSVNLALELCAS